MTKDPSNTGAIALYQSKSGNIAVDVTVQEETVWLSQKQMAELFGRDVRTISEHVNNVFSEGELDENSVIRNFRTTASDGKQYDTNFYNLDVIISVGYRVKSQEGTQFRIWATNILRDHLLKGYTLNQKRLQQKQYEELKEALTLIQSTMEKKALDTDEAKGLLEVITDYTQSWLLFAQYDEDQVEEPPMRKGKYTLTYEDSLEAIKKLQAKLQKKDQASQPSPRLRPTGDLFGQERESMLEGIIGNLHQTFDKKELYSTVEEKAAHLLYFVIKDHPFSDGNKRIGSLLFLLYLNAMERSARRMESARSTMLHWLHWHY